MALSRRILDEIAIAENDPTYSVWAGHPPEEDVLLRDYLGGDRIRYREIANDPQVEAKLQERMLAVVAREWEVVPASESDADKKIADFVKDQLQSITFDRHRVHLLRAVFDGFAVCEILWQRDREGRTVLKGLRDRPPDRYTFRRPRESGNTKANADVQLVDGYELRLLTRDAAFDGVTVPDRKFICHSVGSRVGSPLGLGLARLCYWPVIWKREAIREALVYGDKFAEPTIIGEYDQAQRDKDLKHEVEEFVKRLKSRGYGVLPKDCKVWLLEAQRSTTTNFYEWLINWCDGQIAQALLAEKFGADAQQGLSGAPAKGDRDIATQLSRADADLLHSTLNDTLIRWLVELNFPKAVPPKCWAIFDTQEDLSARATRDQTLYTQGFRLTLEAVKRIYGDDYVDIQDTGDDPLLALLGSGKGKKDAAPPQDEPGPEPEGQDTAEPAEGEPEGPVEASEPIDFVEEFRRRYGGLRGRSLVDIARLTGTDPAALERIAAAAPTPRRAIAQVLQFVMSQPQ